MKLETKVGAFFLAGIAILGLLIIRTEKMDLFTKKSSHEYGLEFKQVAGLSPLSKVRIAGVPVGTVQEIKLIPGGLAKVTIGMPQDVPVYADASAQLSSLGILGEKYVELDQGHPNTGPMPENGLIATREGVNLDNLMESLAAISKDVKGITGALNESIGGEQGRQKLDEIVDNIRVLTGEIRVMAQENHGAVNATLANAQAITSEIKDRLPRLAQQFEDLGRNLNGMATDLKPEMKDTMGDIRKLAQNFQSTSENLRSITDKINRGEGTIGKLLNDETTVNKINAAVDSVSELAGGMKNLEVRLDMNAARWTKRGDSQTGLDLEIATRPDYWYELGLHSTPDGKINQKTTVLTPTPGFPSITKEVTADQTLTISAQFAKRLGKNFVVSAGVIEGKGGAGVEYRTMDDQLRMGLLAYDFTKRDDKPKPRYRFTTSYQFWKGLYAQAGLQDFANPELKTFFVGGGVRWKDEDMKKFLGLVGSSLK